MQQKERFERQSTSIANNASPLLKEKNELEVIMVATCDCLEGQLPTSQTARGTEENDSAVSSTLAHVHGVQQETSVVKCSSCYELIFCLSVFKALPVTWPGVHIERVRCVHAFVFHSPPFLCTVEPQQYRVLNNVIIETSTEWLTTKREEKY